MSSVPENWQARPVQRVRDASVILARSVPSIYNDAKAGALELVKISPRFSVITTASIIKYLRTHGIEVPQ